MSLKILSTEDCEKIYCMVLEVPETTVDFHHYTNEDFEGGSKVILSDRDSRDKIVLIEKDNVVTGHILRWTMGLRLHSPEPAKESGSYKKEPIEDVAGLLSVVEQMI
jgi:hypothetical protein